MDGRIGCTGQCGPGASDDVRGAEAGYAASRSRTSFVEAEQYSQLVRLATQLASLLMMLSASPQALEMLPETARMDLLCLARDLAVRVSSILETPSKG
jgi:hypothetical protein